MSLPAADELFRNTGGAGVQPSASPHPAGDGRARPSPSVRVPAPASGNQGQEPTEHATAEDASAEAAGRPETQRGSARTPRQTRATSGGGDGAPAQGGGRSGGAVSGQGKPGQRRSRAPRRPSGRERHDEKITVYVSAEELMDLEHARLVLRGEHGLAVDRGRIVREAVAVVLADLESRGDASILVRRLRGR